MRYWFRFAFLCVTGFVFFHSHTSRADVFIEGWRYEKPFGWVYYAQPSWAYDVELGWLRLESLWGQGTTGKGWNAKIGDFNAPMGSDWVYSGFFGTGNRWMHWNDLERCVVQGIVPVESLEGIPEGDSFSIPGQPQVDGITLTVPVSYAGGCEEHSFKLYVLNRTSDWTVYPPMVPMVLVHDAGGDTCEAAIFETLHFDLGIFLPLWKSAEFTLIVNEKTVSFPR